MTLMSHQEGASSLLLQLSSALVHAEAAAAEEDTLEADTREAAGTIVEAASNILEFSSNVSAWDFCPCNVDMHMIWQQSACVCIQPLRRCLRLPFITNTRPRQKPTKLKRSNSSYKYDFCLFQKRVSDALLAALSNTQSALLNYQRTNEAATVISQEHISVLVNRWDDFSSTCYICFWACLEFSTTPDGWVCCVLGFSVWESDMSANTHQSCLTWLHICVALSVRLCNSHNAGN